MYFTSLLICSKRYKILLLEMGSYKLQAYYSYLHTGSVQDFFLPNKLVVELIMEFVEKEIENENIAL